jgi:hypothetical protein
MVKGLRQAMLLLSSYVSPWALFPPWPPPHVWHGRSPSAESELVARRLCERFGQDGYPIRSNATTDDDHRSPGKW